MSVRSSLAWVLSAQVLSGLVLFGGSVVMARLLSPAEIGVYAFGFAAAGLVNAFGTLGIASYIIREVELTPLQIDSAFTVNALASVAIAIALLLASGPAAYFLHEPGVATVLQILAIRPLFATVEFRPMAMLQREQQFQTVALIASGAAILNVGMMIFLALMGFSYVSMAIGTVAGGAFSAGAYIVFVRQHARFALYWGEWRRITNFGVRMLTISGVAQLGYRLSEIIMGRLLGLEALGIFTRATQIWDLIFFNIYGTAARVVFSKLSGDYRERADLRKVYLTGLKMITAIMWPMACGIAVLAPAVIYLLFGKPWLDAAIPLAILMIALVIASAFSLNWEIFVIVDETGRQTRFEVARAAAGVSSATAGSLVGIAAAAAGRVVDCAVGFILYIPHLRRLTGVTGAELRKVYAHSALLAIGAVIPSLALMFHTHWAADTPPLLIAAAVAAGVVMWVGMLAVLRHPLADEMCHLSRSVLGRAP